MSTQLRRALEQVARRLRSVRLWGALALCWTAWALVGLALDALLARPAVATIPSGWLLATFAALASATAAACTTMALRSARDRRRIARRIEAKYPVATRVPASSTSTSARTSPPA